MSHKLAFHALRCRIKAVHANLFTFLGDQQRTTADSDAEVGRLGRGMQHADPSGKETHRSHERHTDQSLPKSAQQQRLHSHSVSARSEPLSI